MLNDIRQTEKAWRIPLIRNIQDGQLRRDREEIRMTRAWQEQGNGELLLHGYKAFVWGDKIFWK